MIDERKTFIKFRYYSIDLKPKSHKRVYAICDECGKERILKIQNYKKLCLSCSMRGKRNHNYKKIFSEKTRRKIGIKSKGRIHSEETKRKMSLSSSGSKGSNWNPNLTDDERRNKRKDPEYKKWRESIFKRDIFTCQICGDNSGGNLNAHHLDSFNNNPDKRTLLKNGITLCETCHKNFHHYYGYGNNTKEQFLEFKASRE